jgi:hypothetical protein
MNQAQLFPGDCWPTAAGGNYETAANSAGSYIITQYYSPAVCPSGVSSNPVYYYSVS